MVDAPLTFVDTNVLASAHDRSETGKQPVAQALLDGLWRDQAGALSTQVLQELYVVVTRKFDPPMPRGAARELVVLHATWPVVQIDVPSSWRPPSWRSGTGSRSGTPWWSRPPGASGRPVWRPRTSSRAETSPASGPRTPSAEVTSGA